MALIPPSSIFLILLWAGGTKKDVLDTLWKENTILAHFRNSLLKIWITITEQWKVWRKGIFCDYS